MKSFLIFVLVLVTLFAGGCASVCTQFLDEESYQYPFASPRTVPQIYSGTTFHLVYAKDVLTDDMNWDCPGERILAPCFLPCNLIDLPLCLVMDTLLLPMTIPVCSSQAEQNLRVCLCR